ncbi:TetR family transcriptional regulator C-terminal domain-containing protein, partial [Burkholderia pseudomallei]|nr:TetR family transcriptional regulator C-terminal domain-containing protein [Burkholderia pseudomallei]
AIACVEGWIASGLVEPVVPKTLGDMSWATAQHYAHFDAQIVALAGKHGLSAKAFDATTDEGVRLILRACGARSPHARRISRTTSSVVASNAFADSPCLPDSATICASKSA